MRKLTLTCILFACSSPAFINVNAQTSQFITPANPSPLTQKQQAMLTRVQNNPIYKSWQWITLGKLTDFEDTAGVLSFVIPGRAGVIHVLPKSVRATSPNDYEWYGRVVENDTIGDVDFLQTAGKMTGSIELFDEDYEIYHTDNAIHLLVQLDTMQLSRYQKCGNDTLSLKAKTQVTEKKESIDQLQTCRDFARILVLYTPAAKQSVPDINQSINLCISHFKTALDNSAITSGAVLEFAGSQQYDYAETRSIFDDVNLLAASPIAQAARDNAKADLVVLLTNGRYNSYYGMVAEIGPYKEKAYAISEINAATTRQETFTHEVGHLYGCRHEYRIDPDDPPYAHGYSFKSHLKTYHTVMVTGYYNPFNPKYGLLNFSNPYVIVHGKATGTEAHENNAREISETFNTIIAFRPPVFRPLGASISGPSGGCCYKQFTFEAYYSCGAAPYTFAWQTSYDGINYGSIAGTAETFTGYLPCPSGNNYYIRLTVHSGDGQVATGFINVYIDKTCHGTPNKELTKNSLNQTLEGTLLAVEPNPFNRSTTISFKLGKQSNVRLEILNSYGQVVETVIETTLPAGKYRKTFKAAALSKGLYLCRLTVDKSFQTKYIMLQ